MADELQKAKAGEKLSEKQTANALDQALDRLGSMQKAGAKMRDMVQRGGTALINSLESHGTTFLLAGLDGYTNDKWTKIGGVPMKLLGGLVLEGLGVYQTMTGGDGSHMIAFGRGAAAVDFVRLGREAGAKLAQPAAQGAAPQQPPATQGTPQAKPDEKGEGAGMRRVTWTPPMHQTPGPDRRELAPRRPARWVPAGRPQA